MPKNNDGNPRGFPFCVYKGQNEPELEGFGKVGEAGEHDKQFFN
jgi:hypothetical protein